MKQYILELFNLGDCEGLAALKTIAAKEDLNEIDRLIGESWKVVEGVSDNESKYHDDVRNIFSKYGFQFNAYGEMQ